ncbi:MAG: 3-dehydroquinate synthase [Candidatus Sericytochromatia bacterium]|nr:3-dehydroquinate synthase [Candidatus Sericytochromatia bacterium]
MKRVELNLHEGMYPALIGQHLLTRPESWPAGGPQRKALVLMDAGVDAAWPELQQDIQQGLQAAGWLAECLCLPAGEELKDFARLYPLYGELLQRGLQRRSLLVAVGGGTLGDAVGFLAATYLRGLDWVNVPTTLLAQVDSALGGKTGVNHPAGKNLIGAIYQPQRILCDTTLLQQLPARDWLSGYGEMLKYGLIHDEPLWHWLLQQRDALLRGDASLLEEAVARSLAIKAHFVAQDVRDLTGIRAVLNFGHTFGHAIEQVTGYGYYRHGEAVILGMYLACQVSQRFGVLPGSAGERLSQALAALPLPQLPAQITAEDLLAVMRHDKKNDGEAIHCLLLRGIAEIIPYPCSSTELAPALKSALANWRQSAAATTT